MSTTKSLSLGFAAICALAMACGDDATKVEKCPAGFVAGQMQTCTCGGDGGAPGAQLCQMDGNLSACDCSGGLADTGAGAGAGGATAGAGGTGTGVAGTTGGTGSSDDDGGTPMAGAGGGKDDGGVVIPVGPNKPATDGTQLASCLPADTTECDAGLTCYTAGTVVGYCTKTCMKDVDCAGLPGGTYTCSAAVGGPFGGTQACRVSCTGPEDKTCPEFMSCTEVASGAGTAFRCLYDEKDIGNGTAKRFEQCDGAGDCEGDLSCYTAGFAGTGLPGAGDYHGYCTDSCMETADCTDKPSTGAADLACGSSDECRLSCALAIGGGPSTCPTGMTCVNVGPGGGGSGRCLYGGTSGGI